MAPPRKPPGQVTDLQGFRYLRHFGELWQPLRACGQDKAGNRTFFFDQYLSLLLLYFFTPALTSLRGLQQACTLDKLPKELDLPKAPALGTLSAAARDFDPDLLRPLLAELADSAVPVLDGREAEALAGLTAVDGSIFAALPKMVWALWMGSTGPRGVKLHLHLDVIKAAPRRAALTPAACSEVAQLERTVEAGRLYVLDRGYACYALLAAILAARSSFLVRLKEDAAFTLQHERPLNAAARAAGVIRDVLASRLGTSHHADEVGQPVRLVWVRHEEARAGEAAVLLLCTDRLDLEAELVALGYRRRWWVELFFRWLKCVLGCRHLLSTDPGGVTIQVYAALIASLLVSLCTAVKPSKRTFEMLCFFFAGWASAAEVQRHIEDLARKQQQQAAKRKNTS